MPAKERIFLVGCPRSGTTLLQSLLAAHPEIVSFPESHFFRGLVANHSLWRRKLRLASGKARLQFNKFLDEIAHDEMQQYLSKFALFKYQYTRAFVRVLDTLTEQQGKNLWLEKTPEHLHYIKYIEKLIVGVKFIHIIRNGADTVASLYEVTRKHSQVWGGPRDIDQCLHRWIKDVAISGSQLHKPNHIVVRYEQLVEDPRAVLTELCGFLSIDFNETMLQRYSAAAKQMIVKWKPWKQVVGEVIQTANSKKFYELFDEEQRQYILNWLSKVSIDELSMRPTEAGKLSSNINI